MTVALDNSTTPSVAPTAESSQSAAPASQQVSPALSDTSREIIDRVKSSSLTPEERKQVLDVANTLGPDRQDALLSVLRQPDGGMSILRNKDSQGATFLSHLQALSQDSNLDPNFRNARGDIARELLSMAVDPSTSRQVNNFTCVPTGIQFMLAREQPAELARVIQGLASPEGKVKSVGGKELSLDPETRKEIAADCVPADPHTIVTQPSCAQSLFQSALMEYGNGPKARYDFRQDANVGESLTPQGIHTAMIPELVSTMLGREYGLHKGVSVPMRKLKDMSGAEALDLAEGAYRDALNNELDKNRTTMALVRTSQLLQLPSEQMTEAAGSEGHFVVALGKENGNVFFFDPEHNAAQVLSQQPSQKYSGEAIYALPASDFPAMAVVLPREDNRKDTMTTPQLLHTHDKLARMADSKSEV